MPEARRDRPGRQREACRRDRRVDCLIVERQSRAHVEGRIRAGVLERTTTDLIERLGLAKRLQAEAMVQTGFNLADGERLIRIEVDALTGKQLVVYGQTELTRDFIEAAPERDLEILWSAERVALHDVDGDAPSISFRADGEKRRLKFDFVIGCDGFHGPSRHAVPAGVKREYERAYPFGWLGILADVPPCHNELIYSNHERDFALASMRSPTRSRYMSRSLSRNSWQVPLEEQLVAWPDERLWDELAIRLGPQAAAGPRRS